MANLREFCAAVVIFIPKPLGAIHLPPEPYFEPEKAIFGAL